MTPCTHLTDLTTGARCGLPGAEVRLQCPAGRPDAVGGPYCDEHGGHALALAEAEREWNYLAPASVGRAEAVRDAGSTALRTPEAYIVLRQTPESQGGTWLAWLGLGSMMRPVPSGAAPNRRGGRAHKRAGEKRARTGTRAFSSRAAAEAAAVVAWRRNARNTVEVIRDHRGGTLDWGVPVEPLEAPIVLVLEQGDSRSGWDVAVELKRRTRDGLCMLSGLRPSGEVA